MSIETHDDCIQWESDNAEYERQECARLFDEFWKPLVCNDDGSIHQDKLNAELWDCCQVMMEVPKVYDHITNGLLSKPNYPAAVVIAEYDDQTTRFVDECVKEETAALRARVAELEGEVERLRGLLREWVDMDPLQYDNEYSVCPWCEFNYSKMRHEPDCPFVLARAAVGIEGKG